MKITITNNIKKNALKIETFQYKIHHIDSSVFFYRSVTIINVSISFLIFLRDFHFKIERNKRNVHVYKSDEKAECMQQTFQF